MEEKVDEKIKSDLSKIVNLIFDFIPKSNILSISLIGSFARGEGSVVVKGNEIYPLNDYDIFVITKKSLPRSKLKLIGKSSAKILKTRNRRAVATHPHRFPDTTRAGNQMLVARVQLLTSLPTRLSLFCSAATMN